MKKHIIFLLIILALAALFGCSTKVVYPNIIFPEKGSALERPEYETVISDEVLNNNLEVKVYSVKRPDFEVLKNFLTEKFEVSKFTQSEEIMYYADEEKTVSYDTSNGYWSYTNKKINNGIFEDSISTDLNEAQCKSIAIKVATDYGVNTKTFCKIIVTPILCEPSFDKAYTIGHMVYFYPIIDGHDVFGVSRFCVMLNATGEIAAINSYYKEIEPLKEEKSISIKKAIEQVKSGRSMELSIDDIVDVKITSYDVGYYDDPSSFEEQPYIQPVIVIKGTGFDSSGNEVEYKAIVPAL